MASGAIFPKVSKFVTELLIGLGNFVTELLIGCGKFVTELLIGCGKPRTLSWPPTSKARRRFLNRIEDVVDDEGTFISKRNVKHFSKIFRLIV